MMSTLISNKLESTDSGIQWRVDAREYLLLALNDLACAAAAVRRRLIITDCACLDRVSVERLERLGEGYVICRP